MRVSCRSISFIQTLFSGSEELSWTEAQAGKFTPVMVATAGLSSAMLILQPERPFSVWFRTSPSVVLSPTAATSPGSMLTVLAAVTGTASRMRKKILYNSHE
ncbi:MAG: hypothetical protein BWY93_00598 [Euryarchaeota archaeon ADurb.BinA087]|nr:MAG: hypothetical protein BWY93_00598 [Euryarchaeota archaeon ADurb.BinA087]